MSGGKPGSSLSDQTGIQYSTDDLVNCFVCAHTHYNCILDVLSTYVSSKFSANTTPLYYTLCAHACMQMNV